MDWPKCQDARAVRRFYFLEQLPLSRIDINADHAHGPCVQYRFTDEQRAPIGGQRDNAIIRFELWNPRGRSVVVQRVKEIFIFWILHQYSLTVRRHLSTHGSFRSDRLGRPAFCRHDPGARFLVRLEPAKHDPFPIRRPSSGTMHDVVVRELLLLPCASGIKHELPRFDVLSNNPFAVRRERDRAAWADADRGRTVRLSDVDRIVVPAPLTFFVE